MLQNILAIWGGGVAGKLLSKEFGRNQFTNSKRELISEAA